MADPILHIKDAYFFEVPKFLWRPTYRSLQEVPAFLKTAHPEATLDDYNHDLAGKIIIPQPFGTLKNLFEADSGFCISKVMIIEVVLRFSSSGCSRSSPTSCGRTRLRRVRVGTPSKGSSSSSATESPERRSVRW